MTLDRLIFIISNFLYMMHFSAVLRLWENADQWRTRNVTRADNGAPANSKMEAALKPDT